MAYFQDKSYDLTIDQRLRINDKSTAAIRGESFTTRKLLNFGEQKHPTYTSMILISVQISILLSTLSLYALRTNLELKNNSFSK